MKRWLFVFMVMALSLLTVSPTLAQADMGCAHDTPTIASLRECVVHAWQMGHIDSDRNGGLIMAHSDHDQALRVASALSAVTTGCCLRYGLFAGILLRLAAW